MDRINKLDKYISELIAAGEVVERPASVVKELLENSIDAGASKVSVEIKNGGVSQILISDNGNGIYKDDVKMAFLRHATSKIKTQNDLESIGTLGFRGEALASICAVSKVEIITFCSDEEIGTRYIIEGGEEKLFEEAGRARGTTIIVRDLFFNTPARMKFLKKDISEGNAVSGVIDKVAMSHPEVSIKFIRDGKISTSTPGDSSIESCIYSVYGKDVFDKMIQINYELSGIKVGGFVSRPEYTRSSRSLQNVFVNNRYVKIKTVSVALEEAFKGFIMTGKYPVCVIYIQIPYKMVDVNVHPSKIEVKFVNERIIFEAVYYAVKSAIMSDRHKKEMTFRVDSLKSNMKNNGPISEMTDKNISILPKNLGTELSFKSKDSVDNNQVSVDTKESSLHKGNNISRLDLKASDFKSDIKFNGYEPFINKKERLYIDCDNESIKNFVNSPSLINSSVVGNHAENEFNPHIMDQPKNNKSENDNKEKNKANIKSFERKDLDFQHKLNTKSSSLNVGIYSELNKKEVEDIHILGEVFNCYIVLQQENDKLIFIDKHAAHERIIYNRLKQNDNSTDSQVLLQSVVVSLDKEEYSALLEKKDLLFKSGYDIEDFGPGSVIVRSAPIYLDIKDIENSVVEIANYILNNKSKLESSYLEWLYHNIACRAAIKAGQVSSDKEIESLVNTLNKNPDIMYCPHGRPIYVVLNKKDIEKQFGRI